MLRNATKRGFTLIELLVVIAIIGILSSVVLASLNNAREKSRDARRASDLNQIKLALELYFDDNSAQYPDTTAGLAALAPTYISSVPTDPQSGSYQYFVDNETTPTDYILGATLENENNDILNGDVDAVVYTLDCTDPVYCTRP